MPTSLPNLPITFDSDLLMEEINKIAEELVHTWNLEGQKLGRTDFIRTVPDTIVRIATRLPAVDQVTPHGSAARSNEKELLSEVPT